MTLGMTVLLSSCSLFKTYELSNDGTYYTLTGAYETCGGLASITIPDGAGIPNLHPLKNNGIF